MQNGVVMPDTDPTRKQCEMGVYPFMFGSISDFEPIVQAIIKVRHPHPSSRAHAESCAERPERTLRLG